MAALLSGILGWLLRNLAALVLIMLVLYGGSLLVGEWRRSAAEVTRAEESIDGLEQSSNELDLLAVQSARQLDDRMALLKQGPGWAIESRSAAVERELAAAKTGRRSDAQRALSLVTGSRDEVVADVQRDMRISLLEHELASLRQLDHERSLEELRRRHSAAYAALTAATPGSGKIWCPADPDSWRARAEARWSPGGTRRLELCRENQRAYEALRALQNDRSVIRTSQTTAIAVARAAASPVGQQLETARAVVARRSSGVLHQIMEFLPAALGILAAALLAPLAIKALLYFVVAPIASRRPPIRILANGGDAAADSSGVAAGAQPVSSVSREVTIAPDHELLVHADYLQSSSTSGTKDTKWLLNAGYPIASIAAGMTVLTRIRPQVAEQVVLSSTTDPFSELGIVELHEDSAMVLQPHNLVGVLQLRDRPVKITSHWRLGSLTAWLTLQLRYLVFHGPGALVIKGCRGIRVEAADSGRMINQAATIGFSAHLAYSTVRTETFAAYLLGRQELFNDRFAGGPGIYVYQEMPHFGKKAGITGRGLNGLLDSMLKVFGI